MPLRLALLAALLTCPHPALAQEPEELASPTPVLPPGTAAPEEPGDPETTLPTDGLPEPPPTAAELRQLRNQLESQRQELERLRGELDAGQQQRAADDAAAAQLELANEQLSGIRDDVQLGLEAQAARAEAEETARVVLDEAVTLLRNGQMALAYGSSGVDGTLAEAEALLVGQPRTLTAAARQWLEAGDLYTARRLLQSAVDAAVEARLSGRAIAVVAR